jgi:hypothetical protein
MIHRRRGKLQPCERHYIDVNHVSPSSRILHHGVTP